MTFKQKYTVCLEALAGELDSKAYENARAQSHDAPRRDSFRAPPFMHGAAGADCRTCAIEQHVKADYEKIASVGVCKTVDTYARQ